MLGSALRPRFDTGLSLRALALWLLCVALLGCSNEMPDMHLTDGTALWLDLTQVGGMQHRADRLLISADGTVRRNKRGNLSVLSALTAAERKQLDGLHQQVARIEADGATGPDVSAPAAWRLRFDGLGKSHDTRPLHAFSTALLARLEPGALLRAGPLVVVAAVTNRARDGAATLRVDRILSNARPAAALAAQSRAFGAGALVQVSLADARAGAGAAPSVFVLAAPQRQQQHWHSASCSFVKLSASQAQQQLERQP